MELRPVDGMPEVRPTNDLAAMIADAATPGPSDVVCVASTVVSKAEGRQADLADYEPSARARNLADRLAAATDADPDPRFVQAVLAESDELLLETPIMLAVTQFGHTCVNAGIDRSNVPDADLLLLPESPADSAARIRAGLPGDPAVIVTDTCGRPFRQGQRGVALGWAGIPAARDWRGECDRDGRELSATVEAVVDELAAAANLVTGEGADGRPVAVVEEFAFGDHDGHDELFRPAEGDLVRAALREWTYPAERDDGD